MAITYPAEGKTELAVKPSKEFPKLIQGEQGYTTLKSKLERKHVTYDLLAPGWKQARDFCLGHVKTYADKAYYLLQGANEDYAAYQQRVTLTPFAPETPQLKEDFLSTLFKQEATRKVQENVPAETRERIEKFLAHAGLHGETLPEMSRKAIDLALAYNRIDGMLDHPADIETDTPYVYLIPPENRWDWEENEKEQLLWVKYHEQYEVKGGWDYERQIVDEYRIVTGAKENISPETVSHEPGSITTYRVVKNLKDGKEWIEGPQVVFHKFHDLPIRVLWSNKGGTAWSEPLTELDLRVFRVESDHAFDLFEAGHPPILAWLHGELKEGDTEAKHEVAIRRMKSGTEKVIHLNPGDSDRQPENVERLVLDIGPLEHQLMHAQELRSRIRTLAGSGTEGVQESKTLNPQSGIALSIEREQKEKRQQIAAKALEKWEWEVVELVIREGSTEEFDDYEDKPETIVLLQYPNSFDQRSLEEITDVIPVADEMGSERLKILIRQNAARKMIGSGADQDVWDEIDAEIEAAVSSGEAGLSEADKMEQEQEFQAEQNDQQLKAKAAQAKKGKPNGK